MATSDISKEALFDPRVVQNPARYAVQKGGVSVATSKFKAITQTASQHTYNINVPSLQVFVDRAIDWDSTCYIQFQVTVPPAAQGPAGGPVQYGDAVIWYGRDFALCAFPLNSLLTTLTAQINDTTVSINTDTVLREVLRLCDYKANRKIRTCPTMLDTYASYTAASGAINTPLSSALQRTDNAESPNGAYFDIFYTDYQGNSLNLAATSTAGNVAGAGGQWAWSATQTADAAYGVPTRTVAGGAYQTGPVSGAGPAYAAYYPIFMAFHSKEKLVLSPFIFADSHEYSTGLFAINNIQLVMNISSTGVQRVVRNNTAFGRTITPGTVAFQTNNRGPFQNSQAILQFITPSLDLPLPAKSVVPYTDFPRYITQSQVTVPALTTTAEAAVRIDSQTTTLPGIPDLLIIYAKPPVGYTVDYTSATAQDPSKGDWYLPIVGLNLNFNNFNGLMNNFSAEQLYHLSVSNGLDMDYNTWFGQGRSSSNGQSVQLNGGFLVVKPGKDFALQTGEAPGLQGQITVQFTASVLNPSPVALQPYLYMIAVQSGFFETLAGSSRIVKNVLSESDIINAPLAPEQSVVSLARMVGNGMASLGNALSKAVSKYSGKSEEAHTMGKGGAGAGMPAGAGHAGAGKHRGGKKLVDRLM